MTSEAAEGTSAHEPLLTILVPTYNRKARLKALIGFLMPIVDEYDGAIELVVSNNSSTDGTKEILPNNSRLFRPINRTTHLPTAEENVFESVPLCRGTYIWCHGDDDIPNLDVIRFAMGMLASRTHDFLVFNSLFLDARGIHTGASFYRMSSETIQVPFATGACAVGLTTAFAGFTNSIQRRSLLLDTDWRPIFRTAPIYSHVAWWLVAFKGRQITFVNKPICGYRDADLVLSGNHFAKVAEKSERADFHFWTSGLADLLQWAENLEAIRPSDVAGAFEIRGDGTNFRLLDNIVNLTFLQILRGVETRNTRNSFSADDLSKLTDWILRIDPGYFECISIIRQLATDTRTKETTPSYKTIASTRETFTETLARKSNATNLYNGFLGHLHNFSLYKHLSGYVAFADEEPFDRHTILRSIDFDPTPNLLLVSGNLVDLTESVAKARLALHSPGRALARSLAGFAGHESRIAHAIHAHAQAVTNASRFPRVTIARSLAWRLGRLIGAVGRRLRRITRGRSRSAK